MTDSALLRRCVQDRSEAAFAELVGCHVNLVFSAATRQLEGNRQHAEDITQAVFADLADKAPSLVDHPAVSGWLYTSAYYAAISLKRKEQRRQAREEASRFMQDHTPDPEATIDWRELRPVLDAEMHRLSAREREAIVLRYFQGGRFAEIAALFGLSDDGARMRVERALEKCWAGATRDHFNRSGDRCLAGQ